MKMNFMGDIKSRQDIKEERENLNKNERPEKTKNQRSSKDKRKKADSKSSKSTPKGNKRGETSGDKKEIPLLTNKAGIHDEVRDTTGVQPTDEEG